jgi:hypothetical protein
MDLDQKMLRRQILINAGYIEAHIDGLDKGHYQLKLDDVPSIISGSAVLEVAISNRESGSPQYMTHICENGEDGISLCDKPVRNEDWILLRAMSERIGD